MAKSETVRIVARVGAVLALALLVRLPPPAVGEEGGEGDPLRSLVQEALERNPELSAARAQAQAQEHRVLPAGSLPDPMLSLSYSNLPVDDFSLDKEPMTSRDIGLVQAFPFPGKLPLREEVARLGAVQAGDRAESLANWIRFRVKKGVFALLENREVARLTEKNQALLKELLAVADSRYAVGKAPQQDLFKAQVEISRMENLLIALRKARVELLADLNTLRDRPVDEPVVLPLSVPLPEILFVEEELVGIAEENNPDLKRERNAVSQREAALRLARKQIWPDLQVGAAYKVREDAPDGTKRPDFFSANVMVSLPIWHSSKQDEEVEAAVREREAADRAYRNATNGIRNRIREITAEIASRKTSLSLYDSGLLPQARESVSSSRAAYEVGQVEFASVLLGQIFLYQQEIEREKAFRALLIRTAELELVVGKELF